MRTYSRSEWQAAQQAWRDLNVSSEWGPVIELARQSGMLYPPAGTHFDEWNDPEPSQWAVVCREFYDYRAKLEEAIRASRSWREVVAWILHDRSWREELGALSEKDAAWAKAQEPTPREAAETIGSFLRKIADSVA